MRALAFAALAATVLAVPAAADPVWRFKPGQTYTYDCSTEWHYVNRAASMAGNGESSGTTTEDPQWETVTLNATVVAVGDDGSARINFVVQAVKIETRFDSSGVHAEWDSTKNKATDIVGFKRYEAIVGHKFQAVIGADGSVKEIKNGSWPRENTEGLKALKKNEREEIAAAATHDPTPVEAWLNLVFATAPATGGEWQRTLKMPAEEKLGVKANGRESVGKHHSCFKSKWESIGKNRAVKPADLKLDGPSDVADIALALVNACEKKGDTWFSTELGCTVKVELEGATEHSSGRETLITSMKWGVELKGRGTTELTPGSGETPSEGKGVTETK